MLHDFERADRIGEFWSYPESRAFPELHRMWHGGPLCSGHQHGGPGPLGTPIPRAARGAGRLMGWMTSLVRPEGMHLSCAA
jgi:hypothetical protein